MQTLYYGGDIITMADPETVPEAVLVTDGRITFIGSYEAARERLRSDGILRDLEGRTLMPSFIDGHSHVSMAAQMSFAADLSACSSYAAIIDTLKRYVEEHHLTEDDIVIGNGYDHNFIAEGGHPVKAVLDQVSETIPIYVAHVSGHMGCANRAMLRLAQITADTPDPEGGKIGRVKGSREPDGYLEEGAMMLAQMAMAGRVQMDMMQGLQRIQQMYLQYGVTTVQDGASTGETVALMKSMCEKGVFELDVVSYPMLSQGDPKEIFDRYPECCGQYHGHFKLGGCKAILDGSPQGKSAWLTKPYEDSGDYCAYPWVSDAVAYDYASQALRDHRQLLVHCNGDAAADQYLRAYEKALAKMPEAADEDLRPVMIHCQTVRDDQLDRMAVLHMVPSIFVGHVYYWGDVHRKNLGAKRARRISPCRSALDRGLMMNFHQDTPVTKPDMMHSVWTAVNRITRQGECLGPEQRIDVYDALKAVTINAAYMYHEEQEKGTLEAGKRADLVILDQNPLKVHPMAIKDIRVLETIKDGKTLFLMKNLF